MDDTGGCSKKAKVSKICQCGAVEEEGKKFKGRLCVPCASRIQRERERDRKRESASVNDPRAVGEPVPVENGGRYDPRTTWGLLAQPAAVRPLLHEAVTTLQKSTQSPGSALLGSVCERDGAQTAVDRVNQPAPRRCPTVATLRN